MPTRKMNERMDFRSHQCGIFGHYPVGAIMVTDPQLILLLLPPLQRHGRAANLYLQIVLVARQR